MDSNQKEQSEQVDYKVVVHKLDPPLCYCGQAATYRVIALAGLVVNKERMYEQSANGYACCVEHVHVQVDIVLGDIEL